MPVGNFINTIESQDAVEGRADSGKELIKERVAVDLEIESKEIQTDGEKMGCDKEWSPEKSRTDWILIGDMSSSGQFPEILHTMIKGVEISEFVFVMEIVIDDKRSEMGVVTQAVGTDNPAIRR